MPDRPSLFDAALSRRGLLGLSAGMAAVLAGCGGSDTTTTASVGGSAATGEPVTIRTCVYVKNHASSALYWQKFEPANWTIEVMPVTGSAQIQDALESGQLDFGLLGAYTTVIASSEGRLTSKIVGMIARQGIGLIGRKGEVATVADLKGKKVAVPPPGAQVLILTELLRKAGLTLGKDVTAVPLGYADHPAALARGDVAAYIGTEPLCTQSVVSGDGVRLTEVKNTPLGDFNTANWASGKILKERPEVVRQVAMLQKQAANYLTPNGVNDKTAWRELLVTQFGYTEQVYEAVLENVGAVSTFDKVREDEVVGAGRLLKAAGIITAEPDYESLYARQYWDV